MVEIANIAAAAVESPKPSAQSSQSVSVVRPTAPQKSSRVQYDNASTGSSTASVTIETPRVNVQVKATKPPQPSISAIVSEANTNLQVINSDLAIEVDKELNQVIFKVIDVETGETIKQIPSEDMLRISKKLKVILENYANRAENIPSLFVDTGSFA